MKFIHCGDLHLGMKPDADRPWGPERARAVAESLQKLVAAARAEKVQLLLIAGDLFHHQPLLRELKEAAYLFSTIPETQVVIIAGNHDRIRESSAVLSFQWPGNVCYFTEEALTSAFFPSLNTEVWGFSYHSREITENRLAGFTAPENDRIRILLCHGGDAKHLPMDFRELAGAGFSYCALGHIHRPHVVSTAQIVYCGSPEPLDLTESGPHGYYLGEISDATRQVETLSFVPLSEVQYISLVAEVSPASPNAELQSGLAGEMEKRGARNIYRVKLRGMRDPDLSFDLEPLKDRFRVVELLDESEPKYDFSRLFAEHPSDMIGFFVQALDKPEMSELDKKALYYGVHALLQTTEERSGAQ